MKRHSRRSCPLDERAQGHPSITCDYLDHWAAEDIVFYILVLTTLYTFYILSYITSCLECSIFSWQFSAYVILPVTTPPQR